MSCRSSSGWLDRERSLDLCEWQSDLPVAWWSYTALQRGGQTVISSRWRPAERTMLFPRSSTTVREDLWDVIGLIGTGSDSYSVTDLFVPKKYSVVPRGIGRDQQLPEGSTADPDPERREEGILYRHSSQAAHQVGLSSVATGIAKGDAGCVYCVSEREVALAMDRLRSRRF